MTLQEFQQSPALPAGLSPALRALWLERRGDWESAHATVQDSDGRDEAWVHAYLHRQEGDLSNAAYWYRRAGRPVCQSSLEAEWQAIAGALLGCA